MCSSSDSHAGADSASPAAHPASNGHGARSCRVRTHVRAPRNPVTSPSIPTV